MVKANLYQSLGQLATVMDDAHLDFLFQRFESARSRPLPDTLRLFGLLQQLVLSDSRVRAVVHYVCPLPVASSAKLLLCRGRLMQTVAFCLFP